MKSICFIFVATLFVFGQADDVTNSATAAAESTADTKTANADSYTTAGAATKTGVLTAGLEGVQGALHGLGGAVLKSTAILDAAAIDATNSLLGFGSKTDSDSNNKGSSGWKGFGRR